MPGSEAPAAGSDIEAEEVYDKEDAKPVAKPEPTNRQAPKVDVEAKTLSDLAKLAPFSDIAVIQRRFLPKTNRFEASVGAFSNLNNPFFTSYGLGLELAYYLKEKYAVEGLLQVASTGSRQVTDDLEKHPPKITTDNLVTSKGFFGAAFKWNPIYGKITWLNKTIVPFDLNFNLGLGMTQTTTNQNEPTVHFGTSQVFAWTKSMAFRWDLSWNIYQATITDDQGKVSKLNQNDLSLGIGMSFYFPEASYR